MSNKDYSKFFRPRHPVGAHYPKDVKAKAIALKLANPDKSYSWVANQFNMSQGTLYRWINQEN
jgi:transposase-like protein